MSKDEKNSSVKSTEHVAAWEKMLQRLDEQLELPRFSGHMTV